MESVRVRLLHHDAESFGMSPTRMSHREGGTAEVAQQGTAQITCLACSQIFNIYWRSPEEQKRSVRVLRRRVGLGAILALVLSFILTICPLAFVTRQAYISELQNGVFLPVLSIIMLLAAITLCIIPLIEGKELAVQATSKRTTLHTAQRLHK